MSEKESNILEFEVQTFCEKCEKKFKFFQRNSRYKETVCEDCKNKEEVESMKKKGVLIQCANCLKDFNHSGKGRRPSVCPKCKKAKKIAEKKEKLQKRKKNRRGGLKPVFVDPPSSLPLGKEEKPLDIPGDPLPTPDQEKKVIITMGQAVEALMSMADGQNIDIDIHIKSKGVT